MPRLTIDGQAVEVAAGSTLLAAAAACGVRIPTLCHADGFVPGTSCMVCVVEVEGANRLLPACATAAADGQVVHTATPEIVAYRRLALELLLSDHAGDCEGPCRMACPASLDIPALLRAVGDGDWATAATMADEALVLPETLGWICPAPCEKACRRGHADEPLVIRAMHREAARRRRAAGTFASSQCSPTASRPVAIVGAGPAGLAAAGWLARHGHRCELFDAAAEAGGCLRQAVRADGLPEHVLAAEVAAVLALPGVTFHPGVALRDGGHLAGLANHYAAVILAFGDHLALAAQLGLETTAHGLRVDHHTGQTSQPPVFAAGAAIAPIRKLAVRAVALGRRAAQATAAWLAGGQATLPPASPNVRLGRLADDELATLLATAAAGLRQLAEGAEPVDDQAARREAARCLHCDCRAARDCGLRNLAAEYGAASGGGRQREVRLDNSHPELVYEAGKCIACGLCVQLAERQGQALGLTFLQRGFATRLAPPFGHSLAEALPGPAADYAALCPVGALARRR